MKYSNNRGFTLIELLVVISIIGLLSSVVLAALQSARQKGQLASVIEFADHNYHKLGADAFAIYNFDDKTGTIARDSSGNNRDLNLSSGIEFDTTNTINGSASSMTIPSVGKYASYTGTKYSFTGGLTLSVWVERTYTIDNNSYSGLILGIVLGSVSEPTIGIKCGIPTSKYFNVFTPNDRFADNNYSAAVSACTDTNKWHNITLSYDSSTSYANLYFDGHLINSINAGTISLSGNSYKILVGGDGSSPYSYVGNIDNAQIFSGSLTASDVQKLYAEGLKEHQDLAKK